MFLKKCLEVKKSQLKCGDFLLSFQFYMVDNEQQINYRQPNFGYNLRTTNMGNFLTISA